MIKLLKSSLLLVLIVVLFQLAVPRRLQISFYERDLVDFHLKSGTDILYFNDSTDKHVASSDRTTSGICDILRYIMPQHSVGCISNGAYNMDIYLAFAKKIADYPDPPLAVIFPINLRSFSTGWKQDPDWQFSKEKLLLKYDSPVMRCFSRPLLAFSAGERDFTLSHEDFDNAPVYNGNKVVGRVKGYYNESYIIYSDQHLRNKLVYYYMYSLSPKEPRLQSMVELLRIMRRKHIKVFFYLTSIDYETGNRYLGPVFEKRISENANVVLDVLKNENYAPLDLSRKLRGGYSWQEDLYPNEHLNEYGRMFTALQLRNEILKSIK